MYDAAELSQLPALLAVELASIGRALASTTRENICAILDAAIVRATVSESLAYERLENMLFAEQRGDDAEIERDEAIARAEAAEARVAELINANIEAQENVIIALGLNPSDFKTDLMEHVINGVIGAMTQRLAELEEALAAANRRVAMVNAAIAAERAAWQWRPVTEDWPHYHDRVVIAHWGGTWAQFARRVQSDDGEDEWLLDDGRKFDFESASVALLISPPPLPH